MKKPRVSYAALGRDEPVMAHPVDHAVYVRVGRHRLERQLTKRAQAVVDALGKRRRVWFDYESVLGRLTDLRQAAYFDLGVEHGVAAERAGRLRGSSKVVEKLAARLVREALGAKAAREDAAAAAVLAAWVVFGGSARRRVCRVRRPR